MEAQILLVIFVGITAVSFAVQAIAMLLMYRKVSELTDKVNPLIGEVKQKFAHTMGNVTDLVNMSKPIVEHAQTISNNITSASTTLRNRVEDLDYFVGETVSSARLQVARISDMVNSATSRFDESLQMVQKGIVTPITEITAITKGLRAGVNSFFRRGHNNQLRRVTQDDELFI